MEINVRQATMADKDRIWEFLDEAYSPNARYKYPHRWMWEFVNNPFRTDENLPIWIALDGDRIVGQQCTMLVPLKIGSEIKTAAWTVDFIVLPECRGKGVGSKIQKVIAKNTDSIFMSVAMAKSSRRIREKIGWAAGNAVVNYSKLSTARPSDVKDYLIHRTRGHDKCHKIAVLGCNTLKLNYPLSWMTNAAIGLRSLVKTRKAEKSRVIDVVEVEQFGVEVDSLWEQTCNQYEMIVRRDSEYLNWKFLEQPDVDYRFIVAREANEAVGYLVVRKRRKPEMNMVLIADIYAAMNDGQTIRTLLDYAVELYRGQVAGIECATSVPEYQSVLEDAGFIKMDSFVPLIKCSDEIVVSDRFNSEGFWFVSKGDHDWDQFRFE